MANKTESVLRELPRCTKCGRSTDDTEIEMMDNKDGTRSPRLFCTKMGDGYDHEFVYDPAAGNEFTVEQVDAFLRAWFWDEEPPEDRGRGNYAKRYHDRFHGAIAEARGVGKS